MNKYFPLLSLTRKAGDFHFRKKFFSKSCFTRRDLVYTIIRRKPNNKVRNKIWR